MKLHAAEFLRNLSTKPMAFIAEHGIRLLPPRDKSRQMASGIMRPMIHQAGKFIFDSGSDADGDTTVPRRRRVRHDAWLWKPFGASLGSARQGCCSLGSA
jgi:hypothetical protein